MSDVYTIFLMVLRDMIRQRMCLRDGTGGEGEGHLEGWQAVQPGEVLDVSCCDVETCTVPGTAHVSL